ncbi:hypothetical protein [Haladaptatus halobius]|uniref:hypothetical protein n=1 Tax=Haladaptatus halobius TaxID=2884875 RepID=UPI001D0B616C|nr:hypothetical protein [Haladaptatus halobius]
MDQARHVLNYVKQDATYGTFGEFPDYFKLEDWKWKIQDISHAKVNEKISEHVFRFTIKLNSDLIKIKRGGLQHLIGILAGDLFYLRISDIPNFTFEVTNVNLPESLWNEAKSSYTPNSEFSISTIREMFNLSSEPLLAFSFKPRVGLKFEKVREISLKVLKSGFNIIELDTRNLELTDNNIDKLVNLAKDASACSSHTTVFSPNLSAPAPIAKQICKRFVDVQNEPILIKIDGGLDGISTCQEIRRDFPPHGIEEDTKSPIITSYPLLRSNLDPNVPPDFFNRALSASGADILYPGGRPNFGSDIRSLDASEIDNLVNSIERYRDIVKKGRPMPSVAGGVHAGQLHLYYELLGPSVAYFLGGAVALHKDGPVKGAALCSDVINKAVELREKNPKARYPPNLPEKMIKRVESAYDPNTESEDLYKYHSPEIEIPKIHSFGTIESWFYNR